MKTYTEKQADILVTDAVAAVMASPSYASIVLEALLKHLNLDAILIVGSAEKDARTFIDELKRRQS